MHFRSSTTSGFALRTVSVSADRHHLSTAKGGNTLFITCGVVRKIFIVVQISSFPSTKHFTGNVQVLAFKQIDRVFIHLSQSFRKYFYLILYYYDMLDFVGIIKAVCIQNWG